MSSKDEDSGRWTEGPDLGPDSSREQIREFFDLSEKAFSTFDSQVAPTPCIGGCASRLEFILTRGEQAPVMLRPLHMGSGWVEALEAPPDN